MSKYDDLVRKLKEIFQIDRPELDFGVYRILNARAGEINDYLDNRLKARVQEALANAGNANVEQLRKELTEAEKNAQALGMNAGEVPKVRELRQRIAEISAGSNEHENSVFSHLLTFFSRYYDSGDFVSQRRYRGDTYAIPYAGEEVVLHWANKDQYYTKSGESFANYSFKLADGRAVHFRLVSADTAKDNRKDNDKERRFVLLERQTRVMVDAEGDEYEDELLPVEEASGDLLLRFEYKSMPKGSKQDDLVIKSVQTILSNETVKTRWLDLTKREPTEKNQQRTLLEKHLTTYTQKNTADYFIHKDLGRFLRGELDFFIKNEVMNLDDVQNAARFSDIEKNLRMIQCLRNIALDLITFLSQLEDFQKKLWLKKKFVVAAHYCITLDRVIKDAPDLLETIVTNEKQWDQWETLGMLEGKKDDLFMQAKAGTKDYLREHPFLMVDTALFDTAFKGKLLGAIKKLDESLDGLLIHGDNFQAINLLQERYREKVRSIYIDPPYNTSATEIIYKNSYKHSSWLSLIQDRIELSRQLMEDEAVFSAAIDDAEFARLHTILLDIFGEQNHLGTVVVRAKPQGRAMASGFSQNHEYAEFFANSNKSSVGRLPRDEEKQARYSESDGQGIFSWANLRGTGANSFRTNRPKLYYPLAINLISSEITIPEMDWSEDKRSWVLKIQPDDNHTVIFPVDDEGTERVWTLGRDRACTVSHTELTAKKVGDTWQVYRKYRPNQEGALPGTWWSDARYSASESGTKILKDVIGDNGVFAYPKSLYTVIDCLRSSNLTIDGLALDFFAGSGTTGHAIIALNRNDNGQRKYILIEQGEYFDTVLKPRIQKVVYSAEWKDGKATAPQSGISQAFKILKIESYEDTLNNLELRRSDSQQSLLDGVTEGAREDYLLRYMLDIESRGSVLSVDSFRKPFNCTLKVAVDSAGACETRSIDLVETFNYLVGLRVKSIDSLRERGIVMVQGTLPTGEKTLILWRDCEQVDYETLNHFCDEKGINPKDSKFDVVYVNGDHNIPSVLTSTEEEGGVTKTLKIRQIEPEFLSRMFDGEM